MSSGKVVNPCSFREFIPPLEKVINHDEMNESYITVENKEHQKLGNDGIKHTYTTSNTLIFGRSHSHENLVQSQHADKLNQPGNCDGSQNFPRHVPVHIIDGTQGMSAKHNVPQEESTLNQMGEVHEHPNVFVHAAASSCNQTVPTFHPLLMPSPNNQEDCRSLFHISSTISSLIVSSLLQNPAAHAAASLAATYWHSANDPSTSTTPNVTAIAAATVAAATAWWASHGLLPVCAAFPSATHQSVFSPLVDNNQARPVEKSPLRDENMDSQLPKEHPPSSSSAEDFDGSGDRKPNTGLTVAHFNEAPPVDVLHDSSKPKARKQVDRSSCGSNTTSSCELEADALEKQGKDKDGNKESDVNLPCDDSIFRRNRSSVSPNESWKEVSEEGRLAFEALFSRQVLPQSFSPPYDMDQQKLTMNSEGTSSQLDLNRRSWVTCSSQEAGEGNAYAHLRREKHGEEGLLTMGLGNVKLKVHHTGFKPYKRCSFEAKESKMGSTGCQNDEKCPKRMRCQGEAST